MNKKKVVGIIVGFIVIVGIGSYVISKNKALKGVKDKSQNIESSGNSYNEVNQLSTTVKILDKTNTDTFRIYKASRRELLERLDYYNEKFDDKNLKLIISDEKKIPTNLLRLAVMHPESIPFVARDNTKSINNNIDMTPYLDKGKVPLFTQFDKNWGYDKYGNSIIALNGCGPTSLTMVISYLTDDKNINPKIVADYSEKHGGYSEGRGSTSALMVSVAKHFGVIGKEINVFDVRSELESGHPVIVDVGYGEFTLTGHILVLTGVTSDGKILMNNPDSIRDSHKSFYLSEINSNAQAYYAYSKA